MSVYYFLINKTKNERIDLHSLIKMNEIKCNQTVHTAFINYMLEHQGDDFTILSDCDDYVYSDEFTEVDLATHKFDDDNINTSILKVINQRKPCSQCYYMHPQKIANPDMGYRCHGGQCLAWCKNCKFDCKKSGSYSSRWCDKFELCHTTVATPCGKELNCSGRNLDVCDTCPYYDEWCH